MVNIKQGKIGIRNLVKSDSGLLLKWLTDLRVLEFYEGRDKKFTEEMIYQEYFEQDNDIAIKVILEYENKPIGYGHIYDMIDEYYEHYGYDDNNETVYCMENRLQPTVIRRDIMVMYHRQLKRQEFILCLIRTDRQGLVKWPGHRKC